MIESPGELDFRIGRSEGAALSEVLRLLAVPHRDFVVSNKRDLEGCFEDIRKDLIESNQECLRGGRDLISCWLHFSSHGDKGGLQLTDGDFISWSDLRSLIVKSLCATTGESETGLLAGGALLLSLSACNGIGAAEAMKGMDQQFKVVLVVGPEGKPSWSECLTAFVAFFHLTITQGRDAETAIRAMNQAAGVENVFQLKLWRAVKS